MKHFTAFFAVEGESIDQNNDIKKEIARLTGADCEELWLVGQSKESALNSYIVSGEYPDFISGDTSLYEAGALLPLDEYWENYPNIKNYLTEEQWERFLQTGRSYLLDPTVWCDPWRRCGGDPLR